MSATHLLDTGWIIRHFRGTQAYTQNIVAIGAPQLAVSVVSIAELYEGVVRSRTPAADERALFLFLADKTILPVTPDICRLFGEHRARLRQQNQLIGDLDLLIAATGISHDLTLLTPSRRHYARVPALRIISNP